MSAAAVFLLSTWKQMPNHPSLVHQFKIGSSKGIAWKEGLKIVYFIILCLWEDFKLVYTDLDMLVRITHGRQQIADACNEWYLVPQVIHFYVNVGQPCRRSRHYLFKMNGALNKVSQYMQQQTVAVLLECHVLSEALQSTNTNFNSLESRKC